MSFNIEDMISLNWKYLENLKDNVWFNIRRTSLVILPNQQISNNEIIIFTNK